MTRGTTIIDLRAERGTDQPVAFAGTEPEMAIDPPAAPWRDRIAAGVAIAAALAWIAVLAWAGLPATAGPAALVATIGTAAAPLALIALLYLLVIRAALRSNRAPSAAPLRMTSR